MVFSEKLQILRKSKGMTQEELAEKLGVSRQAVAKWESSLVYPDIYNLVQISNLIKRKRISLKNYGFEKSWEWENPMIEMPSETCRIRSQNDI